MNYEGEKFLYALFRELYKKDSVIKADIKDGKNSGDKFELLAKYLNRIKRQEKFFCDEYLELEQYLKRRYHDRYVIKEEDILDSYFEYLENAALELGVILKYDDDKKEIEKKRIIKAQEESLDKWLDFLMKDAHTYPMWIRYWIFQSVTKLGNYNNESNSFSKRSKSTINPFPELNEEAVLKTMNDIYNFKYDGLIEDAALCSLIDTGNFGKIYAYNLLKIFNDVERKKMNLENAKSGIWKEFHEEEWKDVVISLTGKGTGWCIAGGNIALKYLEENDGKFDIYYTKDKDGKYTIPRACIRYSEGKVQEIRGAAVNQNLEDEILDVVYEKIIDCPGIEKFTVMFNDMKQLSEIIKKQDNGILLTKEEVKFVYEIDKKITCFGYKSDPRIDILKSDSEFLKNICKVINDDEELMLKVIEEDATLIKYAAKKLQSNKKFLISALCISSDVYLYIDEELKMDEEFIIEGISKSTSLYKMIDDKFKNDREFLKKLLRRNAFVLYFFDEELKVDKELVLEAFKTDTYALVNVPCSLRNNASFMLELAKIDVGALNYIGDELRGNKKFLIDALKYSYNVFRVMSESLKVDKDFLLESIKYNSECYRFFDSELKNDEEVILELIKYDHTKFENVNEEIRNNKEFLLKAISKNYLIFNYLDKNIVNDKKFMIDAIKVCDLSFDFVSDELKNDREFMFNLVEFNSQFLLEVGEKLKNDKEFVLYGVSISREFLRLINREFLNDKDVMINAVKSFSNNIVFLGKELKTDKEFLLDLVGVNIDCLKFMNKDLKNNKEFVLKVVNIHNEKSFDYLDDIWKFDEDVSLIINSKSDEKKLTYTL